MEHIKNHFEEEAKEFDKIIIKLIPYYPQMIEAVVDSIPFNNEDSISVLDLGCGTGTISKAVIDKYPNAKITCVDIAANMLEMAKIKLGKNPDYSFIQSDFYEFVFPQKFDVILSSLAIHHLVTDNDKKDFFAKIFNSLNKGGSFFNADVVLATNEILQEKYINRWIEFMKTNVEEKSIHEKWLPTYYEEDRPTQLMKQLKWLTDIGFLKTEVIWKYYNFAVYGGYK